ncbi:MAG: inorganic phosphate transporter [Candidatus Schekmanbacteria bacterium]|nr:MAG: inorganic phosphate transporter [Candidatus Schekmanbacteria bacterium]
MTIELYFFAVLFLGLFAVLDLIVGVSNDASNFLNSSLGSKVAPRYIILSVASLGILMGVVFSSGMMEVARKGIFHPKFFTMPNLLTIFLAVMLTDIVLLDLFNTYALPTSTTVSVVFELLGGAVAVSVLKIIQQKEGLILLGQYINTSKAMVIIFGILLSVIVAFLCGAVTQFFTRLLFTFDYSQSQRRYGGLWGGVAMASITYFILIKGAKGASFITPETVEKIKDNSSLILFSIFLVSAVILQLLIIFKINIFKPIVLIGTFALAMAFAANDLVNFIGVPMAGYHSYRSAISTPNPLTSTMEALEQKVPAETAFLLIAGLIMVATLWISKKARTVSSTEISLAQQYEGEEKYESAIISRIIVRMALNFFNFIKKISPLALQEWFRKRLDTTKYKVDTDAEHRPSFDLLRASVNLMVASALISYATSHQLPLSTTYVTFMVAMGTSFADQAWGRESAVYRVSGVITVITGWFFTAMSAFILSFAVASVLFYGGAIGFIVIAVADGLIILKNHRRHSEEWEYKEKELVFNLKKITDVESSISITFEHIGLLIHEIRISLDETLKALYVHNEYILNRERRKTKKIQRWSNITIANIFKCMRLLQKSDAARSYNYGQTIRRIQRLSDGYRDIVLRCYNHVADHHKMLLDVQINELKEVMIIFNEIMLHAENALCSKDMSQYENVVKKDKELKELAEKLNQNQIERIRNGKSKTRHSILFYSIVGNALMLSKQNLKLMEILSDTFGTLEESIEIRVN